MAEENSTYASSSTDSGQPTTAQLYALAGGAGPVNPEYAQQLIDAPPDGTSLATLALGPGTGRTDANAGYVSEAAWKNYREAKSRASQAASDIPPLRTDAILDDIAANREATAKYASSMGLYDLFTEGLLKPLVRGAGLFESIYVTATNLGRIAYSADNELDAYSYAMRMGGAGSTDLAYSSAGSAVMLGTRFLDVMPGEGAAKNVALKTLDGVSDIAGDLKVLTREAHLVDETGDVIRISSGTKGGWNKELNGVLKPYKKYEVDGYLYKTDGAGRVAEVEGDLTLKTRARNTYQQVRAGKNGVIDDEGGHFIASIFDGPGEKINLFSQNKNFNRGEWKKLENSWADALKSNQKVNVSISPVYKADSMRPDVLNIRYTIDGGRPIYKVFYNKPGG